ncbi:hypothetical protein OUZ56_016505 [Daphnia magna]|uniref:Uncharacterized protein n=1 Tax=Daphnia magna TaxID=35525 RepID=A0ABR0AQQ7_9CRUS|nr:hypothetical protein OUZ56_016505 [Daphnia magna]
MHLPESAFEIWRAEIFLAGQQPKYVIDPWERVYVTLRYRVELPIVHTKSIFVGPFSHENHRRAPGAVRPLDDALLEHLLNLLRPEGSADFSREWTSSSSIGTTLRSPLNFLQLRADMDVFTTGIRTTPFVDSTTQLGVSHPPVIPAAPTVGKIQRFRPGPETRNFIYSRPGYFYCMSV